jgi:hypothetical protein
MKTRKALAALVLAAFSLSIAAAAFAQSGTTSGTVQATPAKPAPKKGIVTTTIKPVTVSPKPASAASATTAKPAKPAAGATAAKKESEGTAAVKIGARSIIGEVVDPGCWMVNGAKGASHKDCAIACAKAGQVLAIVESKTQKLYMIATDKPGEDPNKGLIDYVGQIVMVKGRVYSRGGATAIKPTSVEPYSATAASGQ